MKVFIHDLAAVSRASPSLTASIATPEARPQAALRQKPLPRGFAAHPQDGRLLERRIYEGIEKKEAWDCLSSIGCDMIQEHYYGKPMPKIEVSEWAKKKFE